MNNVTLKKPIVVRDIYQQEFQGQKAVGNYKLIFMPNSVTSLEKYEAELINSGVSAELTQDIIGGLADSPLYESKTS